MDSPKPPCPYCEHTFTLQESVVEEQTHECPKCLQPVVPVYGLSVMTAIHWTRPVSDFYEGGA